MNKTTIGHWECPALPRISFIIGCALLTVGLSGCFKDPDPGTNPYVTKEVDNAYWCATITTAEADGPGGSYPAIIREWNPRGSWDYPTYCACAPEYYINNEILDHLGMSGSVITSADQQGTQDFRDQLFAGAVLACENMWTNGFLTANPASTSEDCDAQLVAGVSPITQGVGPCSLSVPIDYAPETGEDETGLPMPEDHWSDYYSLTSAIDYDAGTYYIDGYFFYDLLAHPEWFIGDSTYIILDGSDWELIGVSPGTVAYALGLQTGDILLSINAYDLSTPVGALDAFSSLQGESSFTLVVDRASAPVTLLYSVFWQGP
jgi:hypothetical protein